MNRTLKYILLCVCGAVLAICISSSVVAGRKMKHQFRCNGLKVVIADSLENSFITVDDVKTYIDREYGQYIGVGLDSIDLVKIEKIVDNRSAVLKSQAYMTKDGTLHIDVTQRRPVVRFQKKDGGFYADADGCIFPLQRTYASHVQVVDGNIPIAANSGYKGEIKSPEEREWFKKIMELVNYIERDRVWKNKIVQIHVSDNGDIILIPRYGKEQFIFGQPVDIDEKFRKMEKYYKNIIPEKGKDRYRKIDLKYNGQIVCR